MYTGQDRAAADKLASNLLPAPSATASRLLSLKEYLSSWSTASGGLGGGNLSVPGEALTMMGLTLGSGSKIVAGMYVEPALVNEEVRGGAFGGGVAGFGARLRGPRAVTGQCVARRQR
jgi:hypothetical protein